MSRVLGTIFFLAFVLCGCSVDSIFESPKAAVIFIIALVVTVLCAAVITIGDK